MTQSGPALCTASPASGAWWRWGCSPRQTISRHNFYVKLIIVKPRPQTPKPQTQKPKTKGPWADTKISWATPPPPPPPHPTHPTHPTHPPTPNF